MSKTYFRSPWGLLKRKYSVKMQLRKANSKEETEVKK